jgi:hypothetical protein
MNQSRVRISDEIALQILQGLMSDAHGYNVIRDAVPSDAKLLRVETTGRDVVIVFETSQDIPSEITPVLELCRRIINPYTEEIKRVDQYLFQIKNAIKYSVSVGALKSALSQNYHRLELQSIKDLLVALSNDGRE